jgi:hypothetical protein
MGEVLADVDVPRPQASPNDIVRPLDALCVVLVHHFAFDLREAHVVHEIAEVDDLNGHLRCRVVLCLRRGQ